jgi:TctA family transporter
MASFAAYAVERKFSRHEPRVGAGAVEGVAGPESANNAAAQTSFIPLLTLGLPANPVMALFIGALIVHGIQPGPDVIAKQPELFWGLIASMWIGNVLLLVLNLPLVGWWARLLRVPKRFLLPATIALSCVGVYSLNRSTFDVLLAAGFGAGGFLLRRLGCDPVPLLLGFILSRALEENLNRALLFADGNFTTFITHPISAVLLLSSLIILTVTAIARVRRFHQAGAGSLSP